MYTTRHSNNVSIHVHIRICVSDLILFSLPGTWRDGELFVSQVKTLHMSVAGISHSMSEVLSDVYINISPFGLCSFLTTKCKGLVSNFYIVRCVLLTNATTLAYTHQTRGLKFWGGGRLLGFPPSLKSRTITRHLVAMGAAAGLPNGLFMIVGNEWETGHFRNWSPFAECDRVGALNRNNISICVWTRSVAGHLGINMLFLMSPNSTAYNSHPSFDQKWIKLQKVQGYNLLVRVVLLQNRNKCNWH